MSNPIADDGMPFTNVNLVLLVYEKACQIVEGIAQRHRLGILELTFDYRGTEPITRKALKHKQVVSLSVNLEEIYAGQSFSSQHLFQRYCFYRLLCFMARVERGQAANAGTLL